MNNHIEQIRKIEKYIKQACTNDAKGLVRLDLDMAITLSEDLLIDIYKWILNLESEGEQPLEVFNFLSMQDIDSDIVNL